MENFVAWVYEITTQVGQILIFVFYFCVFYTASVDSVASLMKEQVVPIEVKKNMPNQ